MLDAVLVDGPEPGAEGEDDLGPVQPGPNQAVVTSTDWTTETIVRLFERKTIDLDPSFQRRDAWTPIRKSKFIESLMMGLPIPQIVLAEKKDKAGQFIVIDGKQRLLALRQFAGTTGEFGDSLAISGLVSLEILNGKTYKQLEDDARFANHVEAFRNQPIRAVVVKNWPNEAFLYLVFLRLNTGSLPLAPQELRQALHPGPFLDFANARSAESREIQACLRIDKPDFRMRDVELMIRFFGFRGMMGSYRGSMKTFLDDTCVDFNKRWILEETAFRGMADDLDNAVTESKKLFPEGKLFSLWVGPEYEGRFNRTVFDIFTFYLSDPKVRKAVAGKRTKVRLLFQKLCTENHEFRKSLQVTTKSLEAVHTRFSVFGRELSRTLKVNFKIPTLDSQRLVLK